MTRNITRALKDPIHKSSQSEVNEGNPLVIYSPLAYMLLLRRITNMPLNAYPN